MNRRSFLHRAAAGTAALGLPATPLLRTASAAETVPVPPDRDHRAFRGSFSQDAHQVRIHSPAVSAPVRVLMIADTHLWMDDERDAEFRPYSARMAKAYNQTRHFQTAEPTNPRAGFETALQLARDSKVDLLALVGDIVSFPAAASIDWVRSGLDAAGVRWLYVAGNHDWHFEGMEGSLDALRSIWIQRRLLPLYQGQPPLMSAHDVGGVRFLAIDNSHYEIQPGQLEFFRTHAAAPMPMVLFVHIPLYAPGRPLGFGCGHPEWGAAKDRSHELERRPRWPESGHTPVTMAFHREVFAAPNLLAVCAGHTHRPSLDVIHGIPQVVTDANATGAYLSLEILPTPGRPG